MGEQRQINRQKKKEEADLIAAACIFVLSVRRSAEWQGVIRNVTYNEQWKDSRTQIQMSCSEGRGMMSPFIAFYLP